MQKHSLRYFPGLQCAWCVLVYRRRCRVVRQLYSVAVQRYAPHHRRHRSYWDLYRHW